MELWHRLVVLAVVILVAMVGARLVDRHMRRRDLAPGAETRYAVLRRTIVVFVVFIGVFSALLVIPQVRALAGGLLASSAVLGRAVSIGRSR